MDERRNERSSAGLLKRSAWLIGGIGIALGGALFIGSAVLTTPNPAEAGGWHGRWGHGGPGDAAEHAAMAVEFVLGWVDATPEQVAQVTAIAQASMEDLGALWEQHDQRRDAFVAEMSKATLDPDAIEQLRKDGMSTVDEVSVRLMNALVEAAGALTLEQRLELVEVAQRFHRH